MNTKYTTRMCLLLASMALGYGTQIAAVAAPAAAVPGDYDGFNMRVTASAREHLDLLQKTVADGTLAKVKNYKETFQSLKNPATRDGKRIALPFSDMIGLNQGESVSVINFMSKAEVPSGRVEAVLNSIRNISRARDITALAVNDLFDTGVRDNQPTATNRTAYNRFLDQLSQREATGLPGSSMSALLSSIEEINTYGNIGTVTSQIVKAEKEIVKAIREMQKDITVNTTDALPFSFNISKGDMAKIISDMFTVVIKNLFTRADRAMQNLDIIFGNKEVECRNADLLRGFLNRLTMTTQQRLDMQTEFVTNSANPAARAALLNTVAQEISARQNDTDSINAVLRALGIQPGQGDGIANGNNLADDTVFNRNGSTNLPTLTFSEFLAQQSAGQIEIQRIKEGFKRGTTTSRTNDSIRTEVFETFTKMQLRSIDDIKGVFSPMLSGVEEVERPGYKAALDQVEGAVNSATMQIQADGSRNYTVAQRQMTEAQYKNIKAYLESAEYKAEKDKLSGTTSEQKAGPVVQNDTASLTTAAVVNDFLKTAAATDDADDLATKLFAHLQGNGKYEISKIKTASKEDLLKEADIAAPNLTPDKKTSIVKALNEKIEKYNTETASLKDVKAVFSGLAKPTSKKKIEADYNAASTTPNKLSWEEISVLAQHPDIETYLVGEITNAKIKKQVLNALKTKKTPGTKPTGKKLTGRIRGNPVRKGLKFGTKIAGKNTAGKNTGKNKLSLSYGIKKKAGEKNTKANKDKN